MGFGEQVRVHQHFPAQFLGDKQMMLYMNNQSMGYTFLIKASFRYYLSLIVSPFRISSNLSSLPMLSFPILFMICFILNLCASTAVFSISSASPSNSLNSSGTFAFIYSAFKKLGYYESFFFFWGAPQNRARLLMFILFAWQKRVLIININ